jgi:3-phenylpropionate/trans-cinnamate dioxygenase ferredoxin subunit
VGNFVRAAAVDEIPEGMIKAFEIQHHRFVIAHAIDGFYATADECTHDGAPIADGRLKGTEIVCARHGARFDLKSGAVTAPPAIVPIDTYELKIENQDIYVYLD